MMKAVDPVGGGESAELAAERRERIARLVSGRHAMRGSELARALGVSAVTVRRDLAALQGRGRVRRVHGGALFVEGPWEEPLFDDKADTASGEKRRIARAALQRVARGDTVYLDGGSTVLELARLLRDRADVTVVTNSLRAAMELSGQGPRLILTGGELRRRSQTMVGALTGPLLERLHVDKAFMGTIGVTARDGLSTTEPEEAWTKERAMQRAAWVCLLADGSKLGRRSFARAGAIGDLDLLITERMEPALRRALRKAGVEIEETGDASDDNTGGDAPPGAIGRKLHPGRVAGPKGRRRPRGAAGGRH